MIGQWILGCVRWAVGVALAGEGDDTAARAHLQRVDPLLRPWARRRLQHEVEACLEADPNAPLGRPMLEAVAARLGVEPANAPRRAPRWWATALLTLAIVGSVAFVWYRIDSAPAPFVPSDLEAVAASKDAYEMGGRPLSLGAAGEKIFGTDIAAFVIALDRHARKPTADTEAALDAAEKTLLAEHHKQLLGDGVYAALANLVQACRVTLVDGESVQGDVAELNAALVAAGLGYFVGEDTLDHDDATSPLLYAYVVERVRVFDVPGGKTERTLWLRRLDKMNIRTNLVGSTHQGDRAAVIRRDLVDDVVHGDLLPVLGKDAPYDLWRASSSRVAFDAAKALEAAIGAKLRAEFAAVGVNRDDAQRLAERLKRRDELYSTVRSRAQSAGYQVALPSDYRFDMAPYRRLEQVVGRRVFTELEEIDEALGTPEMAEVYKLVRSAYVAAVEFHELQHRLDDARPEVAPEVLARHLGSRRADGSLGAFDGRLVTEYSAYLAELANADLPFTVLSSLLAHAFNRQPGFRLYALAAITVAERLCTELAIEHDDFIGYQEVEHPALAAAFLSLLDLDSEQIRAASRRAWESDFGAVLARPALRPVE